MSAAALTGELLNMQQQVYQGEPGICSAQDATTARMPGQNGMHGKEIEKKVMHAYLLWFRWWCLSGCNLLGFSRADFL